MPAGGAVEVKPITPADVKSVAQFLHDEMNRRIAASTWVASIGPAWAVDSPNHGFMLISNGQVVGVQLAFYSQRLVGGSVERFCNVAAWCVLPQYRAHGIRLLRAVLAQKGYTFTDLSPSGNVVPLNRRLNFQSLDTDASLVINLPWPAGGSRVRIASDRATIERSLGSRELNLYRDHAGACAACHLVIVRDGRSCYVIFRRDRRKGLPLFASILHVSDPDLFRETSRHVFSYLFIHYGIAVTILEYRVVGYRPSWSVRMRSPRAKMYRSDHLQAHQIDYLYSELVSVPW